LLGRRRRRRRRRFSLLHLFRILELIFPPCRRPPRRPQRNDILRFIASVLWFWLHSEPNILFISFRFNSLHGEAHEKSWSLEEIAHLIVDKLNVKAKENEKDQGW